MITFYDITLSITYTYDSPAAVSRNILHILPRSLPDQQLITGLVSIDPQPDYRRDITDFFGNAATEIEHNRPVEETRFRFSGRVSRNAEPPAFDLSPRVTDLAEDIDNAASLAPDSPHHFMAASDRVSPHPEITAFAQENIVLNGSCLAAVRNIASALNQWIAFDDVATDVDTPPIEAFRDRRGVCQDFSHIMIAALRGIGIPAGYVSGFLRTVPPPGQERLEGADAMHAWVQAWCGAEMGWVQIDPTNDIFVGTDHVVVAIGRDYSDVAPVKGSLRGIGSHTTSHEVDVVPLA
jgi:transglutaminase-like putative cysteine protease